MADITTQELAAKLSLKFNKNWAIVVTISTTTRPSKRAIIIELRDLMREEKKVSTPWFSCLLLVSL